MIDSELPKTRSQYRYVQVRYGLLSVECSDGEAGVTISIRMNKNMNKNSSSAIPIQHMDDTTLLEIAEKFYEEERLLKSAEALRNVKDKENILTDRHQSILRWAEIIESGIDSLLQEPEKDGGPWIKQKESHGHRDFLVFYQLTKDNQLVARLDCAFESSLLVPLLSVFNESDLYSSWMPSWQRPIKLGVSSSVKLKQEGRGNQIIHVTTSLAWPLSDRDMMFRVIAVDAIEDDHGCIAIQAKSQTPDDDPVIPEPAKNVVRTDFSNFLMFRACPPDHPCVTRSAHLHDSEEHEPLILLSASFEVNPHISYVPQSVQNFATRTVIGQLWLTLSQVAEDVREGKRPKHKEAIDAKPELYEWIEERAGVMIKNLGKETSGCEP